MLKKGNYKTIEKYLIPNQPEILLIPPEEIITSEEEENIKPAGKDKELETPKVDSIYEYTPTPEEEVVPIEGYRPAPTRRYTHRKLHTQI